MHTILVPFDGSAHSANAIQFVVELHHEIRPITVHLLNVQDAPHIYGDYSGATMFAEIERKAIAHGHDILIPALKTLQAAGITCTPHVRFGPVASTIAEQTETLGCTSIVMGTRGMGTLGNVFIGSVAMKVIHLVHVPVTLVKSGVPQP